jgi:tryptophan-rich sensory protein
MKDYQKLIISVLIPLLVGFIGSFFTSDAIGTWYSGLVKPSFNPPAWLFAPAWTILYILIGISFYLVWKTGWDDKKNIVLGVYSVQLILNLLWSILFFGLRNPLLGLIEIIVLWFVILLNIIVFYRIKKEAGILLVPYLFWVSFASVLNYYIFILN